MRWRQAGAQDEGAQAAEGFGGGLLPEGRRYPRDPQLTGRAKGQTSAKLLMTSPPFTLRARGSRQIPSRCSGWALPRKDKSVSPRGGGPGGFRCNEGCGRSLRVLCQSTAGPRKLQVGTGDHTRAQWLAEETAGTARTTHRTHLAVSREPCARRWGERTGPLRSHGRSQHTTRGGDTAPFTRTPPAPGQGGRQGGLGPPQHRAAPPRPETLLPMSHGVSAAYGVCGSPPDSAGICAFVLSLRPWRTGVLQEAAWGLPHRLPGALPQAQD